MTTIIEKGVAAAPARDRRSAATGSPPAAAPTGSDRRSAASAKPSAPRTPPHPYCRAVACIAQLRPPAAARRDREPDLRRPQEDDNARRRSQMLKLVSPANACRRAARSVHRIEEPDPARAPGLQPRRAGARRAV